MHVCAIKHGVLGLSVAYASSLFCCCCCRCCFLFFQFIVGKIAPLDNSSIALLLLLLLLELGCDC